MRQRYTDVNGTAWLFDQDRAVRMISHYARNKAMVETSSVVRSRDSFLQKIRLADALAEVKSDQSAFTSRKAQIEAATGYALTSHLSGGWDQALDFLITIRRQTVALSTQEMALYQSASGINQAAIDSAETAVSLAKGVRNGSVIGLGIIATVATGGATIALASASGAGLSATASYQDTGDFKKAAVKGSLFLIPVGLKKVQSAAKVAGYSQTVITSVSIAIDAAVETFENVYFNEASLDVAIQKALISTGVAIGSDAMGSAVTKWSGNKFRETYQIFTDAHGGHVASNRTYPLLGSVLSKATDSAVVAGFDRQPGSALELSLGADGAQQVLRGPVSYAYTGVAARMSPMQCARPASDPHSLWVQQNVLTRA